MMEFVGEFNIAHLFTSLLLGSIGVAVFFFKTTNSLDKRITKLETQIDVGKNNFKDIKEDNKEIKSMLHKMANQVSSLVAVLKSRGIVNGDYSKETKEGTWYNK